MGKHSEGTSSIFWRSLFLSVLKWGVIAILPILAAVGGWSWLSNRDGPSNPPADNPVVGSGIDSTSPAPGPSPGGELSAAQILNGSGNPQFLAAAQKKLRDGGYEIVTTGNASRPYEKTTIFYQQGQRTQAESLARLAGATVTEAAPANLDKNIPLTLVVGADFSP